jgi:hypothetical protein
MAEIIGCDSTDIEFDMAAFQRLERFFPAA